MIPLLLAVGAHAGTLDWVENVAVALGTPEGAGERLSALRAQLDIAGESDPHRASVRSVEPVLDALDSGDPIRVEDRIAVVKTTMFDGRAAGFEALRQARVRAATDPDVLAVDAWVGSLLERLVTARDPAEARGHIANARTELAGTPGAAERLAVADLVVRTLHERPDERLRPLLTRALSRNASDRAQVADLMSSVDGPLELVRLGVRTPETYLADNELAVTSAYWYACRVDDQLPTWSIVESAITASAHTETEARALAHRAARDRCRSDFEASWTFLVGGRPTLNANALVRSPVGRLSCTPRALKIRVGTADSLPEGRLVVAALLLTLRAPVLLALAAGPKTIRVQTTARPPDCMTREEAEGVARRANEDLRARVLGARP